jgi:hypothetical protein
VNVQTFLAEMQFETDGTDSVRVPEISVARHASLTVWAFRTRNSIVTVEETVPPWQSRVRNPPTPDPSYRAPSFRAVPVFAAFSNAQPTGHGPRAQFGVK